MGIDFDVLLSNLLDNKSSFTPELMEILARQGLKSSGVGAPFVSAMEALERGTPAPQLLEPNPMRQAAQEKISAAAAEVEAKKQAEAEAATADRLSQEQVYDAALSPAAWLEPSMGGDQDMAGKLQQIRAEAMAKGRAGSLSGGAEPTMMDYAKAGRRDPWEDNRGTLSQQPDSPEIQQRLADRDAWAAEQPMRNLEFAMTPEQAGKNPNYAASAAEALAGLQGQQALDRRQQIQEMFVSKLAGAGGTVPREQAVQLQALGVDVPYGAMGSSSDEGIAFFDRAIQQAGEYLAGLDEFERTSGHPMIKVQQTAAMKAEHYRKLIESGLMNPDDARQAFQRELAEMAFGSGVINMDQAANMQQ